MYSAGSDKVPFMVTCKHENKTPDFIKGENVTKRKQTKLFQKNLVP
jgi:hypothetical protein